MAPRRSEIGMSKIGYKCGSEWHLLRYLGYHRDALNQAVRQAIPGSADLAWLDWSFEQRIGSIDKAPPRFLDVEFEGLDFLPPQDRARLGPALRDFWPQ